MKKPGKKELPKLVETEVTRQITATLTATQRRKLFSAIFGDTGRSKTITCAHYAASNSSVVMVELKGGSNYSGLISAIAIELLGKDFGTTKQNKLEIDAFLRKNERMLIVDETNQLFFASNPAVTAKSFEFLRRDIYDLTGTPVVLVFTRYSLKDLRHGSLSGFLEQLRGRIGYPLQIPTRLLKMREVKPIVNYYVPTADKALIEAAMEVASPGDGKLRTLVKYLDLAKEYVSVHGGKIDARLLLHFRDRYEDGGAWPED
jgi:DNA transposition AAA+ family ATPase